MKQFIENAKCKLVNNKIILQPLNDIKNMNIIKYPHLCEGKIDEIFDMRSKIINKHINKNMYIYIKLYDENKNPINISNNIEYVNLNMYERKIQKTIKYLHKIKGSKHFFYYPTGLINYNIYSNDCLNYINYIHVNQYQLAAETISCFSNNNIDGFGFFSFSINLIDANITPKYASIVFTDYKYHDDNIYIDRDISISIESSESDWSTNSTETSSTESVYESDWSTDIEDPSIPPPTAPYLLNTTEYIIQPTAPVLYD